MAISHWYNHWILYIFFSTLIWLISCPHQDDQQRVLQEQRAALRDWRCVRDKHSGRFMHNWHIEAVKLVHCNISSLIVSTYVFTILDRYAIKKKNAIPIYKQYPSGRGGGDLWFREKKEKNIFEKGLKDGFSHFKCKSFLLHMIGYWEDEQKKKFRTMYLCFMEGEERRIYYYVSAHTA